MPLIQRVSAAPNELIQRTVSSAYQDKVIEKAKTKLGKIEAKKYESGGGGKQKRKGYQDLIEIFHKSAPGIWSDNQITYDNTVGTKSIPHWCGIFALWASKEAGANVGTWSIGKSIPTISGFKGVAKEGARKGDVGILFNHNHHFLVQEVQGDKLKTIDGNSGNFSEVKENTRPFKMGGKADAKDTTLIAGFFRPESAQAKLTVGKPFDVYEMEADRVADAVIRKEQQLPAQAAPEKKVQRKCDACADDKKIQLKSGNTSPPPAYKTPVTRIQRQPDGPSKDTARKEIQQALEQNKTRGSPLPEGTRMFMEKHIGADFSNIRIHTGKEAAQLSGQLNAQAFTYGHQIYFNESKFNPATSEGKHLLAHELTHTIQQGAAPVVQRKEITPYAAHAPPALQKAGNEGEGMLESAAWELLGTFLPATILQIFRDIRHKGIFEYIKEKISDAASSVFKVLKIDPQLLLKAKEVFAVLAPLALEIINGLRQNNCKPLFAALKKLKDFLNKIIGDVWDSISKKLDPVVKFFNDIWETYAAPFIDKVKGALADIWNEIKSIASEAWNLFKRHVQNQIGLITKAWDYLKGWLGIGSSTDTSQEKGFIDWIKEKALGVWNSVKELLKPVIEPAKKLISTINALMPWSFINALKEKVQKFLADMGKMAGTMEDDENGVANQQATLRSVILPAIKQSVIKVKDGILDAGKWVNDKISAVTTSVQNMITSVASVSFLSGIKSYITPVQEKITELADWGKEKVHAVFDKIGNGVLFINKFIEPVFNTLEKLVSLAGNLMAKLPDLVMGPMWWILPACIKDPIKDWIINKILKNIPIFSTLLEIPEIWPKVKQRALSILKAVFADGNLKKAAWLFFSGILQIFNIPPTLVTGILKKAAAVFGDIIKDPINFLRNLVLAVKDGFMGFFSNIGTHLINGFKGWLFSAVTSAGVKLPATWDFQGIIGFIMDLFNLNMERILQRMEKHPKIGKKVVDKIRSAVHLFEKALPWIKNLIEKGPKGMWEEFKEKMKSFDFIGFVIEKAIAWITQKIIAKATQWLISLCDVSGITPIINTIILIYDAIQAFFRYLKQMLEVVDRVLDGLGGIVKGAIAQAAGFVEDALDKILPIAIGFAASIAGLGNISEKIKEILEAVNKKIDEAIDAIINGAVNAIEKIWQAILSGVDKAKDMVRKGIDALFAWWEKKAPFKDKDNKPHNIFFEGEGDSAQLMVASKKEDYETFLSHVKVDATKPEQVAALAEAKKWAKKLQDMIRKRERSESIKVDNVKVKDWSTEFTNAMAQLAQATSIIIIDTGSALPVSTMPVFGGVNSFGFAKSMRVEVLTKLHPEGSPVNAEDPGMGNLLKRKEITRSYYIAGHLLNNNLGGPGSTWSNLTPIPQKANQTHEQEVESKVKKAVNTDGLVMFYSVDVTYGRTLNSQLLSDIADPVKNPADAGKPDVIKAKQMVVQAEVGVPLGLNCIAYELENDGKTPKKKTPGGPNPIEISQTIPVSIAEKSPSDYVVKP